MIEIQDDIPLPTGWSGAGRPAKYPFGQMNVGNSFFMCDNEKDRARRAAWAYGNCNNRKFASRRVEENGVIGIRIWRIT